MASPVRRVAAVAGHVTAAEEAPFAGLESPTRRVYPEGTERSLMGNMEPVLEETTGALELVYGSLPTDLDGFFIRNGPSPAVDTFGKRSYHEFTGDAMLHSSDLNGGRGTYSNRFVRTRKLGLQQEKGRPLRQVEMMDSNGEYLGAANTALVHHARKLLALYEVDKPYVLSLPHLETAGQLLFEGALSHSVTAHPKVCPETGELIFFGYEMMQPVVHYSVADKDGKLLRTIDVPTQGGRPVMMHDMAITTNYSILLEFPLYLDISGAAKMSMPYTHDVSQPSRFGVLPRHASSVDEIRWFEGATAYCFHIANAWEEGDTIKLVGCPQAFFSFDFGKSEPSLLHEWTFDLKTGATSERQLDGQTRVEFPVVNPRMVGKKSRFAWAAIFTGFELPLHSICGCVKYDLATGDRKVHHFVGGRFGGESVFAPRGGSDEDDGYLLTYTYNPQDSSTELYVVDARTMSPDPVAILKTPQRVPFGFHGLWVPRDQV